MWGIEKWARLRSHTRPEPAALPALRVAPGEPQTAITHEEKAKALSERFFPKTSASTANIPDKDWPEESFHNTVRLDWSVSGEDIPRIIDNVGANKAPGEDALSNGFLKAC
ncbi:hypothetical protein C8A03DRAFT_19896, partial [Achaetomium macrosporum]